jgi:hypothetical protein
LPLLVLLFKSQFVHAAGVWKNFKYCQHCQLIIVERAKWSKCWDDIKYCSDRCRSAAKRASKLTKKDADGIDEESQ